MVKVITLAAVSALALTVASQPASAGGNGGAVAAGIVGGLAVGAIIGSQVARPNTTTARPITRRRRSGFTNTKIAASFIAATSAATATSTSAAFASVTDATRRSANENPG